MSKYSNSNGPTPADEPATVAEPSVSLSLTEFCVRLSETVRRPELIGAFESVEKASGRSKATEPEFRARYDAFVNKPI